MTDLPYEKDSTTHVEYCFRGRYVDDGPRGEDSRGDAWTCSDVTVTEPDEVQAADLIGPVCAEIDSIIELIKSVSQFEEGLVPTGPTTEETLQSLGSSLAFAGVVVSDGVLYTTGHHGNLEGSGLNIGIAEWTSACDEIAP